jgi:shikimate kinase
MADPDVLVDRIGDPASRPLLAGLDRAGQIEKLGMLLSERLPFYQQATIQIDTRGTPDDVVGRILDALESR